MSSLFKHDRPERWPPPRAGNEATRSGEPAHEPLPPDDTWEREAALFLRQIEPAVAACCAPHLYPMLTGLLRRRWPTWRPDIG